MSAAREILANISATFKNTDIAWEDILRANYLSLLPSGANCVDVGANAGEHTATFIERLDCQHLAVFEPIPALLDSLERRWKSRPNVSFYRYALGKTSGSAEFFVKVGLLGESGLRQKARYGDQRFDNISKITVEKTTLDAIDLGFRPDYIKIDIEGGEMDMLYGAEKTIAMARPIISAEYGYNGYAAYGYSGDALALFAERHMYRVHDILGNIFTDKEEFMACINRYYWDYLLIPEEKESTLSTCFAQIRESVWPLTQWLKR